MRSILYLIIIVAILTVSLSAVSRRYRMSMIDTGGLSYSSGDAILMENGTDALLLEIGDKILVE